MRWNQDAVERLQARGGPAGLNNSACRNSDRDTPVAILNLFAQNTDRHLMRPRTAHLDPSRPVVVALALALLTAVGCVSPTRLGWSAYHEEDYARAWEIWSAEAEKGDADAQYLTGLLHEEGRGVDADPAEAAAWYLRAAEQGHAAAQNNLGLLYYDGRGVERSHEEAARWFSASASQGFARAWTNRGVLYLFGHGVPQSHEIARAFLREAAEGGDAKAQALLGAIYREGIDVEVDPEQAAAWYGRAAEAGLASAQLRLGLSYLEMGKLEDAVECFRYQHIKIIIIGLVCLINRSLLTRAHTPATPFSSTRPATRRSRSSLSIPRSTYWASS